MESTVWTFNYIDVDDGCWRRNVLVTSWCDQDLYSVTEI